MPPPDSNRDPPKRDLMQISVLAPLQGGWGQKTGVVNLFLWNCM